MYFVVRRSLAGAGASARHQSGISVPSPLQASEILFSKIHFWKILFKQIYISSTRYISPVCSAGMQKQNNCVFRRKKLEQKLVQFCLVPCTISTIFFASLVLCAISTSSAISDHSWNKAVWKPKGFTRENCFQQISRGTVSLRSKLKKKLGFIFDFSPG